MAGRHREVGVVNVACAGDRKVDRKGVDRVHVEGGGGGVREQVQAYIIKQNIRFH